MAQFMESDKPHIFPALMCILPIFMTMALLWFFPRDGGNFTTLMFFFVILAIAGFGAYMVKDQGLNHTGIPFFSAEDEAEYGTQTLQKEKEGLDRVDLILIPIGVGVLLGSAIILTKVGGPILALLAGAVILTLWLLRSQTVIIPWTVHAIYNIIVVISAQFSLIPGLEFSSSPIFVPSFSFDEFTPADFITQAMMQVIAVALTEEVMRVSVAMGISILLPLSRTYALGLSSFGWIVAHTIIAYRA